MTTQTTGAQPAGAPSSGQPVGGRTYGGWRLSRGVGVGRLDTRQTFLLLAATGATALTVAVAGLRWGLAVGLFGAAAVTVALWRVDGVALADYAAAAARFRIAERRGETDYLGGVLARWPQSTNLPGVLATTELLDVEVPGQPRCGLVWDRRSSLLTGALLLATGGTLLTDRGQAHAWVTSWGQLLAGLADQPAIRWATVTVDITPDAGAALAADHATRIDPSAPLLARQVMGRLAAMAPQESARVQTRMSVTVDPTWGGVRVGSVADGAAQALRVMSAVHPAAAGAEVVRRATALDLVRMVRCAFDPDSRQVPAAVWQAEPLGWGDAGPTGAVELPGEYRHETATSITWGLVEAPRQRVAHSVLVRLLGPGRFERRVTLLYRVLSRDEAAGLLEREVTAADARAAYRAKTRRDENARERRDREMSGAQAAEEAAGAGLVQFSLLVTTTVTDPADLPLATAEVQAAAAASQLRLRVVRFGQAAAFAAGLPCGVYPPHLARRR